MTRWRPQHFRVEAESAGRSAEIIQNVLDVAEEIHSAAPFAEPVFSLAHLAKLAGSDYGLLRAIVRRDMSVFYRIFRIRKRPAHDAEVRYRVIAVPTPSLMRTQRWIAQSILAKVRPHKASVAFSKNDTIYEAAHVHCNARWLIKMDVRNFFESISEISAYRVFRTLGYQPLVAFELGRLSTRLANRSNFRRSESWQVKYNPQSISAYDVYTHSGRSNLGHLPQGAPTSPMLANLAMREFDAQVQSIADQHGLRYTRYADDITFSTRNDLVRVEIGNIIAQVYRVMTKHGLSPNVTKTRVSSPGTRKIVLGLLVDGHRPKLPKEFKSIMRRHIYYITHPNIGPVSHAHARRFISVRGFRRHLEGLLSYAKQIEPDYALRCETQLSAVEWPL